MANVLINSTSIVNIANAIREKTNTTEGLKLSEMPSAIESITTEDTSVGSRQWWLDACSQKTYCGYMFFNCSLITTIPPIDTSNSIHFGSMFMGCSSLVSIPQLDTSNGTYFGSMFNGCSSLISVDSLDVSKGTYLGYMFKNCYSLVSLPTLDFSSGTTLSYVFQNCYALEDISFVPNSIKLSISFAQSSLLSDESIQSIIDGLADLTGATAQTLSLNTNVKSRLTTQQSENIASKNWSVA